MRWIDLDDTDEGFIINEADIIDVTYSPEPLGDIGGFSYLIRIRESEEPRKDNKNLFRDIFAETQKFVCQFLL